MNINNIRGENKRRYILMFGIRDLIPEPWFGSSRFHTVEDVYKACVEQNTTWRELTGWNYDRDKDIAL